MCSHHMLLFFDSHPMTLQSLTWEKCYIFVKETENETIDKT